MGYVAWSAQARVREAKRKRLLEMEEYAEKLRNSPYEKALEDAQQNYTFFSA